MRVVKNTHGKTSLQRETSSAGQSQTLTNNPICGLIALGGEFYVNFDFNKTSTMPVLRYGVINNYMNECWPRREVHRKNVVCCLHKNK